MSITAYDTGPPKERPSGPLPEAGKCVNKRRQLHVEGNRSPRVAQRCRATLCRVGDVTFASQLNLENDESCRVRVTFHGQQLQINLCSFTRLSWVSAVLEPAENPDFAGHVSWENRRYLVGVHIRRTPRMRLDVWLRPLHLYRATNQNAQLEEVK